MQKERENQKLKEICSTCGLAKPAHNKDSSAEQTSESKICSCIKQPTSEPEIPPEAEDLPQVASFASADFNETSSTAAQQRCAELPFWNLGWKISLAIGAVIALILTLILLSDSSTTPYVKFGHIVLGCFAFAYEYYLLYSALALTKLMKRFAKQHTNITSLTEKITRIIILATMPGVFIVLSFNAFLDFANMTGAVPLDSAHLWRLILGNRAEVVVMSFLASLIIGIIIMAMIHRAAEGSNSIKKFDNEKR